MLGALSQPRLLAAGSAVDTIHPLPSEFSIPSNLSSLNLSLLFKFFGTRKMIGPKIIMSRNEERGLNVWGGTGM